MKALTDKILERIQEKKADYLKDNEGKKNEFDAGFRAGVTAGIATSIGSVNSSVREAEFEEVAREMIKHLNNNPDKYHPHMTVIIDSTTAELVEGKEVVNTNEYLKD